MIDLRQHLHLDDVNPIYAAGAAALAVVILFAHFAAPRKSKPAMTTLSVRWGREKLRVPLPAPDTNLGTLRAILVEQTGLPPSSFKLVHAGAVMKDDNAPLSAYGLRSGSRIAIIDGGANAHTAVAPATEESKSKAKPETEEATITVIRDELTRVQDNIAPALDVFLVTIAPPQSQPSPSSTATASDPRPANGSASLTQSQSAPESISTAEPAPSGALPDIEMEHRRLGEELLQSLLRLDVLSLDGSWTLARTERKSAVKTIQELLDRLDGGWRQRKERIASQQQVQG